MLYLLCASGGFCREWVKMGGMLSTNAKRRSMGGAWVQLLSRSMYEQVFEKGTL